MKRKTTKRISIALLGLGSVFACASMSASASNTFPGTNGKIAVIDTSGYVQKLRVIGKRGRLKTVARSGKNDFIGWASFAPSGNRILYTYTFGEPWEALAIVNLATGNSRSFKLGRLSAYAPAFLENGRILFSAFVYPTGNHLATYVMRRDGTHRHKLFDGLQLASTTDGHWFVNWAERRKGTTHRLLLLNRKGKEVRALTPPHSARYRYLYPEFSPNGRWVAYEREIERRGVIRHRSDVFIVRRDGTHRRRLTTGGHSSQPTISPDGRWIAFRRTYGNGAGGNIVALSVRHPDRRRVVTNVMGAQFQDPNWASRKAAPKHGLG